MEKKIKLGGIALLTLVLGLSSYVKVSASDYIEVPADSQLFTKAELDEQRTSIDATLTTALNNGQLTDVQADSIRAKISQNCKLQESYMSDGAIDLAEGQEVNRSLLGIAEMMQDDMRATVAANAAISEGAVMANVPLNTTISTARFYKYGFGADFVDGGPDIAANVANFNNKELCLSAQLEEGRSDGRLSGTEYFFLKGKLNDLAARTQQIADLRRHFTWTEQEKMVGKLNDLQAHVNDHLSDNEIASVSKVTM